LPIIYGFIEISDLDIILKTWSIIDIPPNPNKKAQAITLMNKFLLTMEETSVTPLVSSKIPVSIGTINSVFIFNILKQGMNSIFNTFKI